MNKLIYLSAVTLTFALQGIAFANTNNEGMSQDDFQQLVCSYLDEYSDKRQALTEVLAVTESSIDRAQKETIIKLAKDRISPQSFCRNVKL